MVTDTPEHVRRDLLATPARPFLEVVCYPSLAFFDGGDSVQVGDRHSFPTPDASGVVEITGAFTHDGFGCYTAVCRHGDALRYTDCVDPDRGRVFSAASYDSADTDPALTIELLEDDSRADDAE